MYIYIYARGYTGSVLHHLPLKCAKCVFEGARREGCEGVKEEGFICYVLCEFEGCWTHTHSLMCRKINFVLDLFRCRRRGAFTSIAYYILQIAHLGQRILVMSQGRRSGGRMITQTLVVRLLAQGSV